MVEIRNLKIRINKDGNSISHLVGWGECLICDDDEGFEFWVNNWQVKAKYGESGELKVYIEFPYKTINKDSEAKKVFYCKPINEQSYHKFEESVISYIKSMSKGV